MPMRRTLKNVVKNYTDAQVKVREATSNDPWGPSSTLMSEIADLTYNVMAFTEIMQMIWKRLNDHGKNWRHVYKSLVVLDYIIKTGSEKVAQQCKENIFAIQTLKDFQYTEDNKDQGMNVREKAKQLVILLKDDERLKNERAKCLKAKERFAQSAMQGVSSSNHQTRGADRAESPSSAGTSPVRRRKTSSDIEQVRPSSIGEEELQLQLALAMSREEHEEELKKQKSDDIKLQMALDESRKHQEEEGPQTLKGMADSRQRGGESLDPWGAPVNKTDPWSASPLPAPPGSSHRPHQPPASVPNTSTDPWASPAPGAVTQPQVDPWSPPTAASHSQPFSQPSDPWSTAPTSGPSSPWGSPAMSANQQTAGVGATGFDSAFHGSPASNGTNGTPVNPLDDAFDVLSSRMSPAKSSSSSSQPLDAFDPLTDSSKKKDPWNMTDVERSLSAAEQQKQRKTPQEFLGANSGLVNLDNLVKPDTTSKKANNPFSSPSSTNPFEMGQPGKVSLSQLQMSSYNSGFTQPSSQGLLPAPMAPAPPMVPMSMNQPMQPQQQGYNPFL